MRPILFFAEKPQVGHESVTLASKYGVAIAISQFRAIVVRAGTDPKQVATLADAFERCAKSEDFRKFLSEELAFADSFIPARDAARFIAGELATIEANAPKKA
jgi:tripartite-type tricarboxylate transporter receptor subunit TctC